MRTIHAALRKLKHDRFQQNFRKVSANLTATQPASSQSLSRKALLARVKGFHLNWCVQFNQSNAVLSTHKTETKLIKIWLKLKQRFTNLLCVADFPASCRIPEPELKLPTTPRILCAERNMEVG